MKLATEFANRERMWKRDSGNWQERLKRQPLGTAQVSLPPSSLPARTRLLADDFRETTVLELPLPDAPSRSPVRESTWVTFTGVSGSMVLDLREYLNTCVGRTLAHYVPRNVGSCVYILLSDLSIAQTIVLRKTFQLVLKGSQSAAAEKPLTENDYAAYVMNYYSVEVHVSWCSDDGFLDSMAQHNGSPLTSSTDNHDRSDATQLHSSLPILWACLSPCDDHIVWQVFRLCFMVGWTLLNTLFAWMRPQSSRRISRALYPGASPIACLTYWLAHTIPAAPSVAEVDLYLWSWCVMHRSMPYQALTLFKRALSSHQSTSQVSQVLTASSSPAVNAIITWPAVKVYKRYSFLVSVTYVLLMLWCLCTR